MSDLEHIRRQAEENFRRNQQAQLAREQDFSNYELRNAYNAEIERQRRLSEGRGS